MMNDGNGLQNPYAGVWRQGSAARPQFRRLRDVCQARSGAWLAVPHLMQVPEAGVHHAREEAGHCRTTKYGADGRSAPPQQHSRLPCISGCWGGSSQSTPAAALLAVFHEN